MTDRYRAKRRRRRVIDVGSCAFGMRRKVGGFRYGTFIRGALVLIPYAMGSKRFLEIERG